MHYNQWMARRSRYSPDKTAIVDSDTGRSFTYGRLHALVKHAAERLTRKFGVGRGDRVALLARNHPESVVLFFACGSVGATLVPLNFRLPPPALGELLRDAEPALLVHDRAFAVQAGLLGAGVGQERLELCELESLGVLSEEKNPAAGAPDRPGTDADWQAGEEDVAMILYTSGTTGRSKGAMIPWRQIHWNSVNTTLGLGLTGEDSCIINTPFYHTGGWHVLLTPLLHHGGKVVLQSEFDPAACNALIERERITIHFGIPTMLRMMMEQDNFQGADFKSLRFAICGGESCPIPVIERFRAKGVPIRQGYGLTEAGPNCYSLPAEDAVRKQGSVGFPNFHIGVRLVDPEGRDVEPGGVGELLMKGPHVFAGYWRNDMATREVFHEGWMRTGDLFRMDEQGYAYVIGRSKEMFISGGENVYPAQVEKVLYTHPDVAQAAVVGVPDPDWGEVGCAFLVPHGGGALDEAALRAFCRNYLAGFQCPKHFVVLEALPLGHSNKIQKRELKEMAVRRLGLDGEKP